jgi:hypothetical protein
LHGWHGFAIVTKICTSRAGVKVSYTAILTRLD